MIAREGRQLFLGIGIGALLPLIVHFVVVPVADYRDGVLFTVGGLLAAGFAIAAGVLVGQEESRRIGVGMLVVLVPLLLFVGYVLLMLSEFG